MAEAEAIEPAASEAVTQETAQAEIRDGRLQALQNGKLTYQAAIAQAAAHPTKIGSYPLLRAAIEKASHVEVAANDLSGYGSDPATVLAALRRIYDQPYAFALFKQVATWAPREVLAQADCYADLPYGVPLIAYAMGQALAKAEQYDIGRNYGKLPVECLSALARVRREDLNNALKQPEFAGLMVRYQKLHQAVARLEMGLSAETKEHYQNLARAFSAAKQTANAPLTPIAEPPILTLSAPSGGGKTTQRRYLLADDPRCEFLVSYTTRLPRPGEVDGIDYHFLRLGRTEEEARAEFQRLVNASEVLEQTRFCGNLYGTPRQQLEAGLAAGKQMIADVNLDGFRAYQATYPNKVRGIFLMQPSLEVLRGRLNERISEAERAYQHALPTAIRQEMQDDIDQRMAQAPKILAESKFYNAVIDQSDCSPKETHRLVLKALEVPLNEVSGYSIIRFGARKAHANNAIC